jgi:hypothetical protein
MKAYCGSEDIAPCELNHMWLPNNETVMDIDCFMHYYTLHSLLVITMLQNIKGG